MPINKTRVFNVLIQLPEFKPITIKAIRAPYTDYDLALEMNWLKKKNPDIN